MSSIVLSNPSLGGIICDVVSAIAGTFIGGLIEKSTVSKSENIVSQNKKLKKSELRKSENFFDSEKITPRLYDGIIGLTNDSYFANVSEITVAIKTNHLIGYAMYYMATDSAKIIPLSKEEKEFVNGVSTYAGYGKIYTDCDNLDIEPYDCDIVTKKNAEKHILDLQYLNEKLNDEEFQQLWKAKLARLMILDPSVPQLNGTVYTPEFERLGFNARKDENGYIHPIFFKDSFDPATTQPQNPINYVRKGPGVSDEAYEKFEKAFSSYFASSPDYHRYVVDRNGNYNLIITRVNAMNAEDAYIIDDGSIMGGSNVYIMGSYISNMNTKESIFVNVNKHPDITSHILSNSFYVIDPMKVYEIANMDYLKNINIYNLIDFSGTDWLDNITDPSERYIFSKNLTAAIAVCDGERMRFLEYQGPTKFTLISDKKCKSSLSYIGAASSKISEGKMISIDGITMIRKYNGKVDRFVIEYKNE